MAAPTSAQIIKAMVFEGAKWPDSTITFSIPVVGSNWNGYSAGGEGVQGSEPYSAYYSVLSAQQADSFRGFLNMWANYAPITFVETNDKTDPGDIRIAFTNTYPYGGYAYVRIPGSNLTRAGDIWLSTDNKDYDFTLGIVGSDAHPASPSATMLHEIGHALGLNHPFEAGSEIPVEHQNYRYSIMSYEYSHINNQLVFFQRFGADLASFGGGAQIAYVTKPMVFDILAIQSIYGVNNNYRSGGDTYTFAKIHALDSGALDGMFIDSIFDGGGVDTIDLRDHERRSIIDLTPGAYSSIDIFTVDEQLAYWKAKFPDKAAAIDSFIQSMISFKDLYTGENNLGIAYSTIIENVEAGSGDDVIIGNSVANALNGNGGDDKISGGDGDDVLSGGAGNDLLDGGKGVDEARYFGPASAYTITVDSEGWVVADARPNGDGSDRLLNIDTLRFSDGRLSLGDAKVALAVRSLLRTDPVNGASGALTLDLTAKLANGGLDQAIASVIKTAEATTSVATLTYEFFTGKIPGQAGIDYLVSSTGPNGNNLNSAYYQSFNLENRYINFAINLGKFGEGAAKFTAEYGALSLTEATRKAYAAIFGGTPTDAKVSILLDGRVDYFAYYGTDGPNGVGTKAAMVGWLLAEAVKADVGVMARSNHAWLTDLSDGAAPLAIDILDPAKGYYKPDFVFGG